MRKDKKNLKNKGVTLISLVIIVVVLLVLSSIIIYVNTSGGTLAARVDKQSKTANEQYLVEESKVIISETYGQKKGTTKDEILNLEREKLDNLKKQYEKGKFAKFFTYKQLISIAKKLPNYFEWRNVDFNNIAAELANIYKVDSLRGIKEMVINEKIKKDYFLSSLIGIDIDFKYISKERLSEFYLFFKNNDTEICSSCKKGSIEDIFIIPEINNSISKLLHTYNEEELLDIVSLMYIGRDNEDIYDYDKIIDHMKMSFSSKDAIINKLLEKRGSMRIYLENSLKIFGKDKLWNL